MFTLSYLQGGLTKQQVHLMLDEMSKIDIEEKKFAAAMHGVDLDKGAPKDGPQFSTRQESAPLPLFGDPAEYEKMTPEMRQAKTDQMMGQWKTWAGQSPLGGENGGTGI